MKNRTALAAAVALLAGCAEPPPPQEPASAPPPASPAPPAPKAAPALPYPASRVVDQKDSIFGVEVVDPYRWLEDAKSPEVQGWMKEQDGLARSVLAKLPERDALAARLKALYYLDSISAPRHRGRRFFYTRRHADKEKSIVYWKEGKDGAEKVLLDPNTWSTDGSVSLGGWTASWDGQKVAYKIKKNNSDEATMYVLDVASGKKSDIDVIEGAKYAVASWTPKNDGFYYVWLPTDPTIPTADRPGFADIRFHKLGQDPKKDALVHEKTGNPSKFVSAEITRDGHYLLFETYDGWASNDAYYKDLRAPKSDWKPLAIGVKAHFNVSEYKDRFYIHTDDGASRYRLFRTDASRPERSAWTLIVPERADAILEDPSIVGGQLVASYLKDASSRLEVHDLDGKLVREIPLPGIGTLNGVVGLEEDDTFYWGFESPTTPSEIYASSIKSGGADLYAKVKVPIDPTPYLVEQAFFTSKDGTRVSMFIVRRKDAKKDGSNRVMLSGYGGFKIAETPAFSATIYPWLERGGIYVITNLRGGGEYGEDWHKAGMLLEKQHVFDDFIAAGEYLVHEGYTTPSRMVIRGGSNGGLLVGAALVQRPDLFGAALCAVPLIDMVRYHLFGSGKTWMGEYGSAADPEQFKALFAYSPYHHVAPGVKYPSVLLSSADSDDRVDPMHARKFAAELQAASAGGPVILRIEKNSGHGGADLVKQSVEKSADELAFALAHTQM